MKWPQFLSCTRPNPETSELHLKPSHGFQGPKCLSSYLPPKVAVSRKLAGRCSRTFHVGTAIWEVGVISALLPMPTSEGHVTAGCIPSSRVAGHRGRCVSMCRWSPSSHFHGQCMRACRRLDSSYCPAVVSYSWLKIYYYNYYLPLFEISFYFLNIVFS